MACLLLDCPMAGNRHHGTDHRRVVRDTVDHRKDLPGVHAGPDLNHGPPHTDRHDGAVRVCGRRHVCRGSVRAGCVHHSDAGPNHLQRRHHRRRCHLRMGHRNGQPGRVHLGSRRRCIYRQPRRPVVGGTQSRDALRLRRRMVLGRRQAVRADGHPAHDWSVDRGA